MQLLKQRMRCRYRGRVVKCTVPFQIPVVAVGLKHGALILHPQCTNAAKNEATFSKLVIKYYLSY